MTEYNYKSILENIKEVHSEKINEWESMFIESVYEYHVENGHKLSSRQKEIILKINSKCMKRPL